MSILIKGMKMPKDGVYWCEIGVAGDIATITIHGEDRRAYNLVPVPEHGRLVDADAIGMNYLHIRHDGMKIYTQRVIDAAPTIIPASQGEE